MEKGNWEWGRPKKLNMHHELLNQEWGRPEKLTMHHELLNYVRKFAYVVFLLTKRMSFTCRTGVGIRYMSDTGPA